MRMRRKTHLNTRMEDCSDILIRTPQIYRGLWLQNFTYDELHLELGCGKGAFITQLADLYPDNLFIAFEKSSNVLISAMELAKSNELKNVLFINDIAEKLEEIFAPNEVSQIYINFCDPWPTGRQIKRRLTSSGFLNIYKKILTPQGSVNFKTDNLPLYEFSLLQFQKNGFTVSSQLGDSFDIQTEYEKKFRSEGLPIHKCKAVKII